MEWHDGVVHGVRIHDYPNGMRLCVATDGANLSSYAYTLYDSQGEEIFSRASLLEPFRVEPGPLAAAKRAFNLWVKR